MACGTPVLAFRAGSVSEVIDEGITGMIVDNVDQARIVAGRMAELDRRKVRRRFEERFTARRMAKEYARVYHGLHGTPRQACGTKALLANVGQLIGGEELVGNLNTHTD